MLTLKHLIMQLVQAKALKRPKTSSYGSLQIQPCFPLCTARDTLQETHLHLSDRHSILISGTWSGAHKSYFSCKTQKMQALLVCVCVCMCTCQKGIMVPGIPSDDCGNWGYKS